MRTITFMLNLIRKQQQQELLDIISGVIKVIFLCLLTKPSTIINSLSLTVILLV